MAKFVHEKKVKVYWATAIANKAAPTVAEMAAATALTAQVPSDGVNLTDTRNNASISMLDDAFVPEQVGTHGTAITLKFTRDDGATDTAWDTFDHGTDGFLVLARGTKGTGLVAGDEVEVYPAESHDPMPLPTAANEYQQFEVQLAVTAIYDRNAVVAA